VVDAVFATLAEIREQGVTVVVVEQRAQLAIAFADRTYVIANGELRLTLGPEDAENTQLLIRAYFGA
jgi:branched-chain amino acid transport system ATP-binding protein